MSNNTTQIRAALVREKGGPFSIETLSLEGPRRDEVLVKVVATGLCHADIVARVVHSSPRSRHSPLRNELFVGPGVSGVRRRPKETSLKSNSRSNLRRVSIPSSPSIKSTKVYQEPERRAATDDAFVFLGGVFDSVNEPVYIDKWMHLASLGNELVARSVADYVEGSLQDRPKLSKPHADKHALGDHR